MSDTLSQAVLEQILGKHPNRLKLVIGNKNYSSWSMRPWLVLKAFAIPFEEIRIPLRQPDSSSRIAEISAAGKLPVLIDHELRIWDSLAICEYLAEQFPILNLWPEELSARARARSICAEMHAGFQALRNDMPMNIRASYPGKGRSVGAQADIGRISEIWEDCLAEAGPHGFLFGQFSIADAFYAPVVMRFQTYGVALAPALQAYMERVAQHPAVVAWVREAGMEIEHIPAIDNLPDARN